MSNISRDGTKSDRGRFFMISPVHVFHHSRTLLAPNRECHLEAAFTIRNFFSLHQVCFPVNGKSSNGVVKHIVNTSAVCMIYGSSVQISGLRERWARLLEQRLEERLQGVEAVRQNDEARPRAGLI